MNVTRRQVLIAALAGGVAVLVVVAVTAVIVSAVKSTSIRETQTENTTLIENTSKTLEIMQGCTTPGEECFDRGQERTAELVAGLTSDLTRVTAYAAACADQRGVQGEDEIFSCVVSRLAAAAQH